MLLCPVRHAMLVLQHRAPAVLLCPVCSAETPLPCAQCKATPWSANVTRQKTRRRITCNKITHWRANELGCGRRRRLSKVRRSSKWHSQSLLVSMLRGDMWSCSKCRSMNSTHHLVCCVASCKGRRPLAQQRRAAKGDWSALSARTTTGGFRRWCNWTACPMQ